MLTEPLAWQANDSENVRVARDSPTLPSPRSPGPSGPAGSAAAVPGGTTDIAVPGAAGRAAPLPGGGPGGPTGACAPLTAGNAASNASKASATFTTTAELLSRFICLRSDGQPRADRPPQRLDAIDLSCVLLVVEIPVALVHCDDRGRHERFGRRVGGGRLGDRPAWPRRRLRGRLPGRLEEIGR